MNSGSVTRMSHACSQLYHINPAIWTQEQLLPLSSAELRWVSQLLGLPHSGTKPQLLDRILDAVQLRAILAEYPTPKHTDHGLDPATDGVGQLAANFKRTELVAMAKRAKVFYSLPKRGIAASLLTWRNKCRKDGQRFHDAWKASQNERPQQLCFRFNLEK